jgi:hypothetical protein
MSPCGIAGAAADFSSGISVMSASVVSSSDAICLVHENGVSNAHDYATAMWL